MSFERLLSMSAAEGGGGGGGGGGREREREREGEREGEGGGGHSRQQLGNAQLKLAERKIQHLTELLHESEASGVRLSDQTKLLKEEIRRYYIAHVVQIPVHKISGWKMSNV